MPWLHKFSNPMVIGRWFGLGPFTPSFRPSLSMTEVTQVLGIHIYGSFCDDICGS